MRWPPAASPGGFIGVIGILLSVLLGGLFLLAFIGQISLPIPRLISAIFLIAFIVLALLFAFLVYGYVTLSYQLSADQLVIIWARQRHVVRLNTIQQILPAVERLGTEAEGWQKFWTGYYVGTRPSLTGLVTVVATLKTRRQLLIVTRDRQFAISPERPVLFLEAYAQLRRALDLEHPGSGEGLQPQELTARFADAGWTMEQPLVGRATLIPELHSQSGPSTYPSPSDAMEESERPAAPLTHPRLLQDSLSLSLLAVAVLGDIVIMLIIMLRYNGLPATLALHWDVNDTADRFGPTRQIWIIPLITWLVTVGNLAFAWGINTINRFAARFLLAATVVVEFMALIALYMLIR